MKKINQYIKESQESINEGIEKLLGSAFGCLMMIAGTFPAVTNLVGNWLQPAGFAAIIIFFAWWAHEHEAENNNVNESFDLTPQYNKLMSKIIKNVLKNKKIKEVLEGIKSTKGYDKAESKKDIKALLKVSEQYFNENPGKDKEVEKELKNITI